MSQIADRKPGTKPFKTPVPYEVASAKAEIVLAQMSLEEKIEYIGGHNYFFIKGVESHQLPRLYLVDSTQGVHLRTDLDSKLEVSTSFPAPIALTSTWNTELAYAYAQSVGEECRAGDIVVLLGPGVNMYRNSQNGRNFEYFGEDPFLAARLVEQYICGMQNTGTIATLKHFMCNNTDYRRRTSNSIVDERTMHEIYLPAFKAGIDAGAMAVMTSYNQINGEWAGQSGYVINDVLRKQLGFKWLVMTDWWSVWDPEKAIKSGLDLDMPGHGRKSPTDIEDFNNPFLRSNAMQLINDGKVSPEDIHRMAKNIITTSLAMGLDRPADTDLEGLLALFPRHAEIALQTAREGIVLLKNDNNVLPILTQDAHSVLLTGMFTHKNAFGGGAADVKGYDVETIYSALSKELGQIITYIEQPTDRELSSASIVLLSIGTMDSEAWDSPFELPDEVNQLILHAASLNPNVVVIMHSGRGVGMSKWIGKVAGLLYCWYPGQIGNVALAEILSGKINPSGKLPISIERRFEDSPAYPYIPEGEALYVGWDKDFDIDRPIHNIEYREGIFMGYRWYDRQGISPLFPFGYGLSYTRFSYSDIRLSQKTISDGETISVHFTITNNGLQDGSEVCQLYINDNESSLPRPLKELKGFARQFVAAGEKKDICIELQSRDFAFYDPAIHGWKLEPGTCTIMVGASSADIRLLATVQVV